MLYTQIFQELYYQADFNCGGRLPIHVTFLLDEFSNVALPDDYCSLLSTMRSREISSVIIIQNLAQIKALFKDTWETIPGNCDTLVYLGGNEQSTHKYISELLGKGTIDKRSSGETKGRQGSSSRNYDVLGRELFTPDEVRKLDNKKCLIFIRGLDPILDGKYIPFAHPAFCQTADGAGIPYVHIPVQKREAERNIYELLSPKALSYYEGLKEKGENVYIDRVSYEEFELLTELELKKRFLALDEMEQREKYHREQEQELEYETEQKDETEVEKKADIDKKIGHHQPNFKLQGEDTIMNRMAQWQYSKEQKAELHKMIALGIPQKKILELFYPDMDVIQMKEVRRTYRPMKTSE
jgi:type IV secretion system protein VirD4